MSENSLCEMHLVRNCPLCAPAAVADAAAGLDATVKAAEAAIPQTAPGAAPSAPGAPPPPKHTDAHAVAVLEKADAYATATDQVARLELQKAVLEKQLEQVNEQIESARKFQEDAQTGLFKLISTRYEAAA